MFIYENEDEESQGYICPPTLDLKTHDVNPEHILTKVHGIITASMASSKKSQVLHTLLWAYQGGTSIGHSLALFDDFLVSASKKKDRSMPFELHGGKNMLK